MKVFSVKQAGEDMSDILQILSTGSVLVCPSDTTYGLLVDATNKDAVEKLIKLKERPRGKPISIFISDWEMMAKYADISKLTPAVRSLLPGSYTVVLPSKHATSSLLEAEDGTLGVRLVSAPSSNHKAQMTNEIQISNVRKESIGSKNYGDLVTSLVAQYGKPLTATSANISGGGLCYSPDAFFHQLSEVKKGLVDAVIDAGELPHHPPSTVIHLAGHSPLIIRANDHDFLNHRVIQATDHTETASLAGEVFEIVRNYFGVRPVVILLDGELGSGKTTWVKYFAQHVGISDIVSPTYTYECEYKVSEIKGVSRFKHYDLYNITLEADVALLDIPRHCNAGTVVCIEWPGQLSESAREALARKAYIVKLGFRYISEIFREIEVWWN